jgi:non-specific serine/threonine protein kinase
MNALEGMASLAAAREMDIRAARLWGAAQAGRKATCIALPPGDLALHEPYLASARSRLGEAKWEEVLSEGRALSLDEAAGYVLEGEDGRAAASVGRKPSDYDEPAGKLSRREREVVALVARGLTNRQISAGLSISERTAGNHVASILRKLHLRSRTQIATWATEHSPLGPEQNHSALHNY